LIHSLDGNSSLFHWSFLGTGISGPIDGFSNLAVRALAENPDKLVVRADVPSNEATVVNCLFVGEQIANRLTGLGPILATERLQGCWSTTLEE